MKTTDISTGDQIQDNDPRRSVDNQLRTGTVAEISPDGTVTIDWANGKRTTIAAARICGPGDTAKGKYTIVAKAKAA